MTFDDEMNTFSNSPNGSSGTWMTSFPYAGEASRTLSDNHEAEYYSDPSKGENPFSTSNGVLNITATPAAAGSNPYGLPYDSGLITTDTSFSQTYGYFEVRAQLPSGQGLWPAFWLLPASNNYTSELDVFETIDNQKTTAYSTVHGTTHGSFGANSQAFTVPDISAGFHAYGVDWEPTTTTFYVDGKATGSAPTPGSMNDPMFMLLNLAVGGAGSWPGAPDATTTFPSSLKIDYVRAYATAGTTYVGGRAALPVPTTIGSGPDTLVLAVSEDAWQGDAQYTVSVDNKQVGGVQTATASHAAGNAQVLNVLGSFGPGPHQVAVNFLNDAYGGTSDTDRNLYVSATTIDGVAVPNGTLALMAGGSQSFTVTGPSVTTDTLTVGIAEDAWKGDAQYTIAVDGTTVGDVRTATASYAAGKSELISVNGSWGAGPHSVGITFLNDAYGGTASTDRNLHVTSLAYDGQSPGTAATNLYSNGTATFTVQAPALSLLLAEDAYHGDAQYSVSVDGQQVGAVGTITASNAAGATQAVGVLNTLAAGWHDVGVSFLNDLYGGSASTDRNLYVKGVEVNGVTTAGSSSTLLWDGTSHVSVYVPQT